MMRISIVTGVIGAFVVLSARLASAEKLTLACTFENGNSRPVRRFIGSSPEPVRMDVM